MRDDPLRYFVPFFVLVCVLLLAVSFVAVTALADDDSENAARCTAMLGIAQSARDTLGAIVAVPHCIPGQRR